jgi:uncharacterized protein YndB with AHSA1/START domain
MVAKNKSNELSLTRLYNAKVEQVWNAWVDPKQVAQWWGPRGFTLTTTRKDVRTGGDWLYTMHGPDGVNWPNHTKFLEVDKYKRLVYDHGGFEDKPAMFRVTVLFSETKGKTKMEMTMTFANPEMLEQSQKAIKEADGNSTWDRLAEFLEKESTGTEKFVINRSFDVGIDTMFRAWTDPKQLVAWSGPIGAQTEYLDVDIRTGGKAFYRMPFGDSVIYGNVHYLEVKHPHRLVYVQQFANADRSPGRHPLAPEWPQSMLTTITFSEDGTGRTLVTLEWEASGEWTAAEMNMFLNGKKSMSQGWGGSFDKLEVYLADK